MSASASADPQLPSPGDVLAGKYRIERLIGRGGMGAVFAAEHILLNQRVAVKLLLGELTSSEEAAARFMNEARAAAQIQGDHVARVFDIAQLPDGTPYMVLEYLEGSDLAAVLRERGPLPIPEVADFALQALDAIAQAHAAGIIHRDLKPANLFLARRHDGRSIVKVLDFGISKNLKPVGGTPQRMTQTRALLGSPEYMSPEQLRTPRGIDTRSDIWSLGVILYELLSGKMPFAGETVAEIFVQILEHTQVPLREIRPEIPPALEALITRCMSRDPNARFATAPELAAALRPFTSDPAPAIDPVRAVAARLPSSPALAFVPAPPVAPTPPSLEIAPNSAAPWANTRLGLGTPETLAPVSRGRVGWIAAACALVLAIGVAVLVFRPKSPSPRSEMTAASADVRSDAGVVTSNAVESAPPATPSAAPPPPPPPPPAPAVATAPIDTPHQGSKPETTAPAPRPATQAAPPSRPAATPPPLPSPRVTPAAAAATRPAKNCSPNYFFDKDGNKHFKPECF
jgi:serine/threonine protein kinase